MPSDAELRTLLRAPESERVERKRSASERKELQKTICAFANDLGGHGGGILVVGLEDDGRCAGLVIDDQFLQRLSELRSDGKLHPFPEMHVEARELDDCEVAVVRVEPSSNPPVRFDGRTWVRVGPTTRLATAEEERRLVERRRWSNLPFDQQPVRGATLDDLDLRRFELEYLPAMVPPDVLAANERSAEDRLRALRLIDRQGVPTVLAVLALGKEPRQFLPGAYVQFVRFDGRTLSDPIKDRHEVAGTLLDQLRRLDELLAINLTTSVEPGPGPAVERPDYPLVALQEIVRNALIHRNYEQSTTPVRVSWYADRVEITSPGGPFGEVTPETFGRENVTSYRNPAIAELASRLGYAQRFGTGIARARKELAQNGNPALDFRIERNFVTAVLRSR